MVMQGELTTSWLRSVSALKTLQDFGGLKGRMLAYCSDQYKQGFGEPGTLTAESQNGYDLEGFVIKDLDAKVL